MDLLPVLRTGEAIVTGEAARLPVRCRITTPAIQYQPRSGDPDVTFAGSTRPTVEGYDRVVASWRSQRTTAVIHNVTIARMPVIDPPQIKGPEIVIRSFVASSNIVSAGYDEQAQMLEVEFYSGSIYQYYNVDRHVYDRFLESPSKGQFLNSYIKSAYPYSRVG